MKFLTPQEQKALIVVFVLLLVGMAVQAWRTAHPTEKATPSTAESK
jgi:hypothetical protein